MITNISNQAKKCNGHARVDAPKRLHLMNLNSSAANGSWRTDNKYETVHTQRMLTNAQQTDVYEIHYSTTSE